MANLIGTTTFVSNQNIISGGIPFSLVDPNAEANKIMIGGWNNLWLFIHEINGNNYNYINYKQFEDNTFGGAVTEEQLNTANYFKNYYLKVNDEIIKIGEHYIHPNFDDLSDQPLVYFQNLERGALGTTAVPHVAGGSQEGIVELWDGPPGIDSDTSSDADAFEESSEDAVEEDFDFIMPFSGRVESEETTKIILNNKPKPGDKSQYNYPGLWEDYRDYISQAEYEGTDHSIPYSNSSGLPKYWDKFQNKDLYTSCIGDLTNEKIIERNLKFEGDPFITIQNFYIQNTGVDGTTKNNYVKAWIFTEAAYGSDPTQDGYGTLGSRLKDEWIFYEQSWGSRSEGNDIGNIEAVEGVPMVSNFSVDSPQLILGDILGSQMVINPGLSNSSIDGYPSGLANFKFSDIADADLLTSIFNQEQQNPLYICVWTRGDKKVAWPVETDERKKKYSVFKINNSDLFIKTGDTFVGTVHNVNFTSPTIERTGGGGSSNSAVACAWRVSSLSISINTAAGVKNLFSEAGGFKDFIEATLPANQVNENIFNSHKFLGALNPKLQLSNAQESGLQGDLSPSRRHPDFIPFTTFGFSQNNQLGENYVDLQNYNYNYNLVMKSSVPLKVNLKIDVKSLIWDAFDITSEYEIWDYEYGNLLFYYFVIDWNDKDDKFKTVADWEESKPTTTIDFLEKQNQNLYKVKQINHTENTDDGLLSNIYTTPGIKNIKFMMISVHRGFATEGTDDNFFPESPSFEVGRWKLCTSRIYLDIPPNQYPDFSDVGVTDYTTIPWPYTTPIIGGVSENSRYKTSIRDTLGGGKIGEFDIIDERFLVNDIENDEMGKNIETMDLEQCRYFNKPYDIHNLLNVNPPFSAGEQIIIDEILDTTPEYLATLPFPQYITEFQADPQFSTLNQLDATIFINEGRPDIGLALLGLLIGNSIENNPDLQNTEYIYPDYALSWNDINDIPGGGGLEQPPETFFNTSSLPIYGPEIIFYNNFEYYDGETHKFPEESCVGQIFIGDNEDLDLKQSCKIELNTGNLINKSIDDTSGNTSKGLLIGDYKIKKNKKGQPMKRDSFIKVPKKKSNRRGAL